MKNISSLLFLMIFTAGIAIGQTYVSDSNGKMSIQGTSNVHDWESEVKNFEVTAKLDEHNLKGTVVARVKAKSIDSGKSIMDNKTYESLKAEEHPIIVFDGAVSSVSGNEMVISGTLNIAGKSRKVEFTATYTKTRNTIIVVGSHTLKMTDYGIEPPTAMLGTMKTGNEIKVVFEINLLKK